MGTLKVFCATCRHLRDARCCNLVVNELLFSLRCDWLNQSFVCVVDGSLMTAPKSQRSQWKMMPSGRQQLASSENQNQFCLTVLQLVSVALMILTLIRENTLNREWR